MGQTLKPTITTIIPTYRRPRLLRRAIRSVLNQTYPHLQVCVYDNASADETESVVAGLAEMDARVKYYCHKENIGAIANFQYGLNHVDTPLFSFLSDDDLVLPEFYELALEGFEKHQNAMFSATDVAVVDEKHRVRGYRLRNHKAGYYRHPNGLATIFERGDLTWTGILFRREVRDIVGSLDSSTGPPADLDFIYRIAAKCGFVLNTRPGAIFVNSGQGDYYFQTKAELRQMIDNLRESNVPPDIMHFIEQRMVRRYQQGTLSRCLYYLHREDMPKALLLARELNENPGKSVLYSLLAILVRTPVICSWLCDLLHGLRGMRLSILNLIGAKKQKSTLKFPATYLERDRQNVQSQLEGICQDSIRLQFSIVIPVYNGGKYLRRCIRSILSQSYGDYEAIFVDDGSTDKSADMIESVKDPRIRLIRQTNKGVSAARNLGIIHSNNPFVAFLDADDEWYPNHLETLAFLINRYGGGGIYSTGYRMEYENGSAPVEVFCETESDSYVVCNDPFGLWCHQQVNNSSNSAVRKEILHGVGLYKEGEESGEDLDLWIRIGVRFPLVASSMVTSIYHQAGSANKPRFRKRPRYILSCQTASRFLLEEREGLIINPRSVREYIESRIRMIFWSYVFSNAREPLRVILANSGAVTWVPLYLRLVQIPGIWPVLRSVAWIQKLLQSRLTLRLRGGVIRKRGIVVRLGKKRETSCK